MSVFNGKNLTVEIFGESHSEYIGGKVSGLPDFQWNEKELSEFLARRKAGGGVFSTARVEGDIPVFSKEADGGFSFTIKNGNVRSGDYNELYAKPRPSHADYAWFLKDGTLDFSGGGRFSGRMTAPLCVVGGLCVQYLKQFGIGVCAYVSQTGKVTGRTYKEEELTYETIVKDRAGAYPSLSNKEEMIGEIAEAKQEGDSVGGKIECVVFGLPGGIGDNLFGGLEGKISSLLYAVPAVKGVEFGAGFDFCAGRGSEMNDGLRYENGEIGFVSNRSGGINGGISNGAPLTIGVAVRPTPSIAKEQQTVDLLKKENTTIGIKGRHDACILPRAVPCIESAVAIALADEIGKVPPCRVATKK